MKKRQFLKLTGIIGAGVAMGPLVSCGTGAKPKEASKEKDNEATPAPISFELPALGYAFDALQPSIDAQTMEIHHDKHHAGYVKKLNAALLEAKQFNGMDLNKIIANVKEGDTGVRNNGGGHYNHSLYWDVITPGGASEPSGKLLDAINSAFGNLTDFETDFFDAAKTRFGSGWAWLSVDKSKKLFVSSTPNQDNPAMTGIVERQGTPILGIDVWEHAYYLNYQNRRGDYINAFTDIVNWNKVSSRFNALV